jgi:hypothetical protein
MYFILTLQIVPGWKIIFDRKLVRNSSYYDEEA